MRVLISIGNGAKGDNYVNALAKAGVAADAVYAPTSVEGYDGLLLAGGEDVDPSYYGQTPAGSHPADAVRDAAEMELIRKATAKQMPTLGICRGMQILNIAFGGTLIQHLDRADLHHSTDQSDLWHPVRALTDFLPLTSINSHHHQAVDRVADGFTVTLMSDEVIEGFVHDTLPVFGVQFHPERMGESGAVVFEKFAEFLKK